MNVLFKSIIIGIPIGITFIDIVGYVARVEGSSMQPYLNPGSKTDYVFLNKWSVRKLDIKKGDVISLISPKNSEVKIIKRVIGLQGECIKTISFKRPVVKIPDGHCWVEGDHVGNSLDSNSFGPVSLGLVTAKAIAIVWPPSRWQILASDLPVDRTC